MMTSSEEARWVAERLLAGDEAAVQRWIADRLRVIIDRLCLGFPGRPDDAWFSDILIDEALKPADETRQRIQAEISALCETHKLIEPRSYLIGLHGGAREIAQKIVEARDRLGSPPCVPPSPPG